MTPPYVPGSKNQGRRFSSSSFDAYSAVVGRAGAAATWAGALRANGRAAAGYSSCRAVEGGGRASQAEEAVDAVRMGFSDVTASLSCLAGS